MSMAEQQPRSSAQFIVGSSRISREIFPLPSVVTDCVRSVGKSGTAQQRQGRRKHFTMLTDSVVTGLNQLYGCSDSQSSGPWH